MNDEAGEVEWAAEVSHADLTRPNIARMYDYLLGGSAHFEVDRAAADQALELVPTERDYSRINRSFLGRAVRYLVTEAGIDQGLDLGSGVPTVGNVHEIARVHSPQAKVAYVDWEAIACHHARHLLGEDPLVSVTELDVCDVDEVLHSPGVAGLLDFSQPVAVLAFGILDLVPSADGAALVERYRDACVPGSALAVSNNAQLSRTDAEVAALRSLLAGTSTPHLHVRTAAEVAELFAGYALVDPGVVPAAHWRPDTPVSEDEAARGNVLGGVGVLRD
ncbi:SAM-dependent methyltransferase [Saccharopolyspora dendranthemae]|uniref:S-adenosyl methyltransferase n=1 Tax=Saccharopolyspora dendranthemae TaxID=1181886 RepID=A0A561V7U2_9PSEU|nr:SAM-dependent methyltransferase [Saccharopolyspora dendranthemae]TWG07685.1 S-adenosyl methyltransferase [Saccharopolyspora dendranthemae]